MSSCSDTPQVQLQTRVYADTLNAQMDDSLQLRVSLADVYDPTSAYLQLV